MIRTLIKPDKRYIQVELPESFIGKDVEILAFTIDEEDDQPINPDAILTHTASQTVLSKDWLTVVEDEAWQRL